MTSLGQLNAYLQSVERRLRFFSATRGLALTTALALALTLLFVFISNRFAFAQSVVFPLRLFVFFSLAVAIAVLLVRPVSRLNRRRVLAIAEQNAPEFQERLLTVSEKAKANDPWSDLLAEDALRVAQSHPAESFAPSASLYSFGAGAVIATALLFWLVAAGPGYWGYGAGLLWTGTGNPAKRPLYDISVAPGNKTIRRKTDQVITAQLNGFSSDRVNVFVKYGNALKWDRASMQPADDNGHYRFLLAGLSDQVEYYVTAKHAASRHFTINVKDLPAIQRVRVALDYPAGLGLQNVVLEPSGDIHAVVGTRAKISILTDRPLPRGQLILNTGEKLELKAAEGNWLTASLPIQKDGTYHFAAIDDGETIRISDDYIIEARKDEPPSVKILKPGGDPRVSPIEEMPVTVTASDDFGIQSLELHYSVNGGPDQTASLLKGKNVKEAEGKTTLYFENFKVAPGDMVSFYATARDAKTTAHSDIVFAQAEPFDYKFSQSQQSGGGGGGGTGNQSDEISKKQKQVIAATFNEIGDKAKARAAAAEDGKFLSNLQSTLGAQAKALAERMGNRELSTAGTQFQQFTQFMTQASADMAAAADQLKPAKWNDALIPEQKALTSLLRAEALFRDIQVAFNQAGGGGGGGGGAQRDLARMFDLELDTSKNQYETGQSAQPESPAEKAKALEAASQRLEALARRQQELAAQNSQQQAFEQRWQEEQLRREAEELKKELQKLAQDSQSQQNANSQSQSGSRSGQGQSAKPGASSGSSSSSSGADNQRNTESLQRAGNAVNQAEEEMRKAVGTSDPAARQRAAAQLRQAQEQISQMMRQQSGKSVAQIASDAQQLADAQKGLADKMKQMYGSDPSRTGQGRSPMSMPGEEGESMPEMNDPNSARFGYGFRRRFSADQMRPPHQATESEKGLASDKEKLAAQLEQLQKQMQQQSQTLASSRPDASAKMSRALSDAEGKELALRMQKNAEWMRQGYGERNLQMEDSVTAGLQQLSRDLKGVRETLDKAPGAAGQKEDRTAQALSEVQDLRAQLQRQRAARGSQGQQSGSGQPGNGQSQNSQSQNAQNRGQQAGNDASRIGDGQPTISAEGVQNTIRQLNGLRAQTNPNDRALNGSIDGALGNLQHLTGAQAGLLDARLNEGTLTSLQRLETELAKRLGQDETAGTRTGAHETSPEKYRDSVASYFRRLSQSK